MAKKASRKAVTWIRGQKAAKRLNVTRPTVLAMVARKELRSKTEDDVLFVRADDVERAAEKAAA